MKKAICSLVVLCTMLLASHAWAVAPDIPAAAVEQRFTCVKATADTQVKASPGFVHTVTFAQDDAAPTAGTIKLFDDTAESGTEVLEWTLTTAVFIPTTVTLDGKFTTGIYLGFTTTADVNVTVCYR